MALPPPPLSVLSATSLTALEALRAARPASDIDLPAPPPLQGEEEEDEEDLGEDDEVTEEPSAQVDVRGFAAVREAFEEKARAAKTLPTPLGLVVPEAGRPADPPPSTQSAIAPLPSLPLPEHPPQKPALIRSREALDMKAAVMREQIASASQKQLAAGPGPKREGLLSPAARRMTQTLLEAPTPAELQRMRAWLSGITVPCGQCKGEVSLDPNAVLQKVEEKYKKKLEKASNLVAKELAQTYDEAKVARAQRLVRRFLVRKHWRQLASYIKKQNTAAVSRLRYEALKEVVKSEGTYVSAMETLRLRWIEPLEAAARSLKPKSMILPTGIISEVFGAIELMLYLHYELLEQLRQRVSLWPSVTTVGDIFIKMAPLMSLYTRYVRDFDRNMETLSNAKKLYPAFVTFCAQKQQETGQALDSFLIMPVQRLPRYQLLLQTLLKYTPDEHVDQPNLTQALAKVIAVITAINDSAKLEHDKNATKALAARIGDESLVTEDRVLMWEGGVVEAGEEYHMFLLNDMIVITRPDKALAGSRKSVTLEKLKLKKKIPFARIAYQQDNTFLHIRTSPTPDAPPKDTITVFVRDGALAKVISLLAPLAEPRQPQGPPRRRSRRPVQAVSPAASAPVMDPRLPQHIETRNRGASVV